LNRYSSTGLNMPTFGGAVKWLIVINAVVFVLQTLLIPFAPGSAKLSFQLFSLTPALFAQGFVWQLFTYQFVHADTMHLLFNLLAIWMFGSSMEAHWGRNRFLTAYLVGGLGAGVIFLLVAFLGGFGLSTGVPLMGASGAIFAIIMAYGVTFANAQVYLFPFPIALKAKYLVAIILGVAVLGLLRYENPGSAIAHLGGALTGFLYTRLAPRRGMGFLFSESYFGMINRYHRWRRRQAAKKFEQYMKEHDRSKYFDEFGNFRDPAVRDRDKENGEGKGGGWVN
jgi:membrane associated rhomboid family serine protease